MPGILGAGQWNQITQRPKLNRAKAFMRGLAFAYRAGWDKGFRGTGIGAYATPATGELRKEELNSVGSVGTDHYPVSDAGRALNEGPAGTSWRLAMSNIENRFTVNNRMTALIAYRNTFIHNNEELAFGWHDGPVPNQGWSITASYAGDPQPNGWHFQINNGAATEFSVANTQSTAYTQVIAMRFNGSTLDGFIDGRLVGSIAAGGAITFKPGNLELFGDGTQPNLCGDTPMAALWNVALPDSAIAQLSADPYTLWRFKDADTGSQFPPDDEGRGFDTDECCCC